METENTLSSAEEPPLPCPPQRGVSIRSNPFASAFQRQTIEFGLTLLHPVLDETILEIGFGEGQALAPLLRKVGENGAIYGVDVSPNMLQISRKLLQKQGIDNRVILEVANAKNLPFDKGFFDAVFMNFTLNTIDPSSVPQVLQECRRVLSPSGRLVVVGLLPGAFSTLLQKAGHQLFKFIHHYPDMAAVNLSEPLTRESFRIEKNVCTSLFGFQIEAVLACP